MQISLSWELFISTFFAVIIAYSFIIGRSQTLKVIIASYIAILAADGLGNLANRFLLGQEPVVSMLGIPEGTDILVAVKILIFVLTIVVITVRGGFSITTHQADSGAINLILNLVYGVLSAGLITSTILLYASEASLTQPTGAGMNAAVQSIYQQSYFAQLMIGNYSLWFSLPAVVFVLASLFGREGD